jgi:hypothetical protein
MTTIFPLSSSLKSVWLVPLQSVAVKSVAVVCAKEKPVAASSMAADVMILFIVLIV